MSSKKKQVEKLDSEQARTVLLEYMKKEYRPYGVTDLVLNLHNKINKNLMIKLLDEMVDENLMIVKRYGKLNFYCYAELTYSNNVKPVSFESLKELKNEIPILEKDFLEFKKEINILKNEPTDAELIEVEKSLIMSNDQLKNKVGHYKIENSKSGDETKRQLGDTDSKEEMLIKKFKKLKKIQDEMIKTLKDGLEGFDQTIEDLGVEPIPKID